MIEWVGTMPPYAPDPSRQQEMLDYISQQGGPKDGNCLLPGCFMWTDVGGDDFTTPSRDQGCCGACTLFGILSAMEIGLKWRYRDILLEVRLLCPAYGGADFSRRGRATGVAPTDGDR